MTAAGVAPSPRARRVVATVVGAMVLTSMPVFLTGALSPLIGVDLGMAATGTGVAIAAFFVAGAAAAIPAGRLVDRIGSATALRVAGLGAALVCGLIGAVVGSFGLLVAVMVLGGFVLAFADTGAARALATAVPPGHQGLAFGSKEASIPLASLLAGLAVPLIGQQLGWRPAYLLAAGSGVLLALLVPQGLERGNRRPSLPDAAPYDAAGRDHATSAAPPGDHVSGVSAVAGASDHATSAAPPAHHVSGVGAVDGASVASAGDRADGAARHASAQPGATGAHAAAIPGALVSLMLLAVSAGLAGAAAASIATFLVPSLASSGLSLSAAGLVLSVASLLAVGTRLFVGALADRIPASELRTMTVLTLIGAVGSVGLALGMAMSRTDGAATVVLVLAACVALGGGWGWTGLVFLAAVRLDPARPAAAASAVLVGLGGGGSIGPALAGILADRAGYVLVWWLAAAAMALATAVLNVARLRLRHAAAP